MFLLFKQKSEDDKMYLYWVERKCDLFVGDIFYASSTILNMNNCELLFEKVRIVKNTVIITFKDKDGHSYNMSGINDSKREKITIGIPIYTDLH